MQSRESPQAGHSPAWPTSPEQRPLPCTSLSTTPASMSTSKAPAWCPMVPRCASGPRSCFCMAGRVSTTACSSQRSRSRCAHLVDPPLIWSNILFFHRCITVRKASSNAANHAQDSGSVVVRGAHGIVDCRHSCERLAPHVCLLPHRRLGASVPSWSLPASLSPERGNHASRRHRRTRRHTVLRCEGQRAHARMPEHLNARTRGGRGADALRRSL